MTVCTNCHTSEGVYVTPVGYFCSGPCMHEYLGWPDCAYQGPGYEKYPACELHVRLDCCCGAQLTGDPEKDADHLAHLAERHVTEAKEEKELWDAKKSEFHGAPDTFLKVGDKVRAIRRVYDLPGNRDPLWWSGTWGPLCAEPGEEGDVIGVYEGHWPTVRWPLRKRLTDVTDFEVEKIPEPPQDTLPSTGVDVERYYNQLLPTEVLGPLLEKEKK